MDYLFVVLLHVACGVLWAGGVVAAGFFFIPAVLEAGPAAGAVMGGVIRRKFPVVMIAAAGVVVLTGLRLYMLRFTPTWASSPEGIVLGAGALVGLGGFFVGAFVQKPAADRLGALGAQIAAAGAPPSPEQVAELAALRARLARVAKVTAFHVIAATLLMASHRLVASL